MPGLGGPGVGPEVEPGGEPAVGLGVGPGEGPGVGTGGVSWRRAVELGLEFGQLLVLELGQECVFSAHWSWAWSWASCWSWELGQECVMSAHWSWALELGEVWVLQLDPPGGQAGVGAPVWRLPVMAPLV